MRKRNSIDPKRGSGIVMFPVYLVLLLSAVSLLILRGQA